MNLLCIYLLRFYEKNSKLSYQNKIQDEAHNRSSENCILNLDMACRFHRTKQHIRFVDKK